MPRGVKQSEALIGVGVAVGLILVVYGASRLMGDKGRKRPETPAASQVLVAARSIPKGRSVDSGDLALSTVPGPARVGSLTSIDTAVGRVAVSDIAAEQALTEALLVRPAASGDLSSLVPLGYRAISIQTTDEIAVSNLLRPGDLVDIQVVLGDPVLAKGASEGTDRSEASTLLQAVRIVSVGEMVGPAPRPGGGQTPPSRTMSLAMTPAQISRFTLARSLGTFYLALRNPKDQGATADTVARLRDVRATAGPAEASPRPVRIRRVAATSAPTRKTEGVELVVGGQSQTLYAQ